MTPEANIVGPIGLSLPVAGWIALSYYLMRQYVERRKRDPMAVKIGIYYTDKYRYSRRVSLFEDVRLNFLTGVAVSVFVEVVCLASVLKLPFSVGVSAVFWTGVVIVGVFFAAWLVFRNNPDSRSERDGNGW